MDLKRKANYSNARMESSRLIQGLTVPMSLFGLDLAIANDCWRVFGLR